MSRLLVLGASGFLGGHVVEAARAHPDVTEVLTPGRGDLDLAGSATHARARLAEWTPDAVLVCTGRLDGTATELVAAHIGVIALLIDAVAGLDQPPRLVRTGSAGEYGPIERGVSASEDHPTNPVNAYGASHLGATHLLRAARLAGAIDGVTLRVFNPVGAGSRGASLPWQVLERLAAALERGADEIATGPLTTWRDFVDARDVGAAMVAAALAPGELPPIINVGSGQARPARDVVTILAELAGFTGEIRELAAAPARSAGVGWTQADVHLARTVLGWTPQHTLRDALAELWLTSGFAATSPGKE